MSAHMINGYEYCATDTKIFTRFISIDTNSHVILNIVNNVSDSMANQISSCELQLN